MIFGVGPTGVFLTNPLENVPEGILSDQLCSDSELLVRRCDVISRASSSPVVGVGGIEVDCELEQLTQHSDERWDRFNVLGQVGVGLSRSPSFIESLDRVVAQRDTATRRKPSIRMSWINL